MESSDERYVKASLILPSLNVAKYIKRCLDSVINQSCCDMEIICVDAGSTDGTRDILEEFRAKDERINLIDSPVKSYGYQINIGINQARGEYVGIVETDDYIPKDMVESLYNIAKKNNIDIVKGDVDCVCERNSEFTHTRRNIFPKEMELFYNKVLLSDVYTIMHQLDYSIWNGLYSRKMLLENRVFASETAGAAFQDIGFIQRALMAADKIYYTDQIVYHYQVDRTDSSTNKPGWLKYLYQEFSNLLNDETINNKKMNLHRCGIHIRMAESFLCEMKRTILNDEGFVHTKEFMRYYEWFKNQFADDINNNVLRPNDFPISEWKTLRLLISSLQGYIDVLKIGLEDVQKDLIDFCRDFSIVIFGSGKYGVECLNLLRLNNIHVSAFCDNSAEKQGKSLDGLKIISTSELVKLSGNIKIIIAMANYNNVQCVRTELKNLGIAEENISVYQKTYSFV
ncbi:glycosyltransferase [Anaerovibrio sp. RM50]|uniref:glycosyltransferase n=1 Tax=Anaerovibrio sp. RM50 TaxID=1200557 RepID=UPI0006878876|nr:glycosyltransferase [Anaerovibrio sp. RM50]